ncbi:hypothetical protein DFAR_2810026 [Desulfarculales bacterium]
MAELKQAAIMDADELLILGLGLQPPRRLVGQCVDTDRQPHEVFLSVAGCARRTTFTDSSGVTSIFSSVIAT